MAYYMGQTKGNKGAAASRLGSEGSGIESSAQSWAGSITVSLHHGSHFTIYTRPDSGMRGREILSGELADLIEAGDHGGRSVPAARVAFCLEQLQEALSAAAAARAVSELRAKAPESRGGIASTLDEARA
jgi:hypothetical protein